MLFVHTIRGGVMDWLGRFHHPRVSCSPARSCCGGSARTQSSAAAFASAGILALNPNLLYLQATPMTEPIFLAGFMALLYCTILFRDTQSLWAVAGAGIASIAASLSRYEGWVLIPFVTLYFLAAARRRKLATAVYSVPSIARSGLLAGAQLVMYWNPLDFSTVPIRPRGSTSARSPSIYGKSGRSRLEKSWLFFGLQRGFAPDGARCWSAR